MIAAAPISIAAGATVRHAYQRQLAPPLLVRRNSCAPWPVISVWIDLAFPRQAHHTPALAPTPPVRGAGHAA